ncbi:AAEL001562-PA [Aedes aegypti]|uniref:AAEL001562-PA n=2 Tax=Aedes aegypti TaxID=7159 RepID=A0A1S4EZA0_AEDAE|nr:endoribonuclease rege-1 [Aedes aegypti]EAT47331.1 AAEL001562-PA [Aedes aegypti]
MARNKKPRRNIGVHKMPGKVTGRSPRFIGKPKLREGGPISERKKKMRDKAREVKRLKQLRERIMLERKSEPRKSPLSRKQILYPPISPRRAADRGMPSTSKLTPRRRNRNRKQPLKPSNSDTIVIDSEDDCSNQPLFYVDTTAGFNDKEVPRYVKNVQGAEDPSVMIVEESALEEGEIRDEDEEDKKEESNSMNKRVNLEEIPIDEDEDDDQNDDDDVVDCDAVTVPKPKQIEDRSVIFCSEVIDLVGDDSTQKKRNEQMDYIPIGFDVEPDGRNQGRFNRSPRKKLFKGLEKKQNKLTNKPAQNKKQKDENVEAAPKEKGEDSSSDTPKKRFVVIDGNNVAFAHTHGQAFSVKGLDICIQYFKKLGHEVKAVVPQFRLKKEKSTDQRLLEELYKKGDILLAPSKNLPGQKSSSYDDRLIISVAEKFDGVIISNDNFRDLMEENDSWKKIIETRVAGYTWVMDAFFLPDDPYGRKGPSLTDMLQPKAKVDATAKDK